MFITEYTHKDSEWKHYPRPPIEITDYISSQIEDNEPFSKKQARYVKDILNESTRFGMSNLSLSAKRKAAWLMLRYRMSFGDAYALYGKYIGNWGDTATVYRFEAVKDGKVVKTVYKTPFTLLQLRTQVSHTTLTVGETYDVAAVRIQMTDQYGYVLPFYNGAVNASVEGDAAIIGESPVILRGGCGGLYLKTTNTTGGTALLRLTSAQVGTVEIPFTVTSANQKEVYHD